MSHYKLNENNNLVQLRDFNVSSLIKQEDGNGSKQFSPKKEDEANIRAQIPTLLVEFFIDKEEVSLPDLMFALEKDILMKALAQCNGDLKKSSKFLGIKYTTLYEKLKKHKITLKKQPIEN